MPITRADRRDAMFHLAQRLESANHGERHSIVELACAAFNLSRQTIYRELAAVGWTSGRKPRADKGTTSLASDTLNLIANLQKTSVRANGKITMAVPTALGIAAANGHKTLSESRTTALLRERGLDVRSQSRAASHVQMRSLHPNHVHQVDASLCLVYYLNGEQRVIRDDELYKNKLSALAKVKFKCIRWVLTDHASSSIIPWYVEAAGENQVSLAEFLLFAWGRQADRYFHGVPKIVVWDKGSAMQAYAVKALMRALEVQDIAHSTGNSRAKGQVECAQNLVEKEFESRLRLEPVNTVDELNAAALAWCNAYNSNAIPRQDTRVHRGPVHLSRFDLWSRIKEDEMRFLPAPALCRALLAGREEERKVMGNLQITFKHPGSDTALRYDLRHLEGISVGDTVKVQPMLYGDCAALVSVKAFDGTPREWKLEPIRDYDENGFRKGSAVWGEFKANPQTVVEAAGRALDRLAYGDKPLDEIKRDKKKNVAPFAGQIDAHSHLSDLYVPEALPKRGTEIAVPDRVSVEQAPLSRIAACKALVAMLDRPLTHDENRKVGLWYPNGVPEADLPQIATALRTHTTPFRQLGDSKEASA